MAIGRLENRRPLLRRRFDGTHEAVRGHLHAVEALASDEGASPDHYADVLIVLGEVLNNIVEHAFAEVENGWIDCQISRCNGHFSIETCDNGTPLPPYLLNRGSPPPNIDTETGDLPEGGFGWFIVHALTEDMIYERSNDHNHLTFSLQVP